MTVADMEAGTAAWPLKRKGLAPRSPPPSRLAPLHLTERQQLALAMEASRRAAAAAARDQLSAMSGDFTSDSEAESEDAYSSAGGSARRVASSRQPKAPSSARKRSRGMAQSSGKSAQTDAVDSIDSTAGPILPRRTPCTSGDCTPATGSPLRTDPYGAMPLAACGADPAAASDTTSRDSGGTTMAPPPLKQARLPAAAASSDSDNEQVHQRASDSVAGGCRDGDTGTASPFTSRPVSPAGPLGSGGSNAGVGQVGGKHGSSSLDSSAFDASGEIPPELLGLPGPDADACTIRAQRLAMRQALSLGARHQSGSGGSGSASMTVEGSGRQGSGSRKRSTGDAPSRLAAAQPKKQRRLDAAAAAEPQSPTAAAAAVAGGLDPALIARLAERRQAKYGADRAGAERCQLKAARPSGSAAQQPAERPQQQRQQQPARAAVRDAAVSLQEADLFLDLAPATVARTKPTPLRVRIKAPERPMTKAEQQQQQQPGSPAATCRSTISRPRNAKAEPPPMPLPTASPPVRQEPLPAASLGTDAVARAAAASPPPTPGAIPPATPVPGLHTPEPSETPAAAADPPFGLPPAEAAIPAASTAVAQTPKAAALPVPFGSPAVLQRQQVEASPALCTPPAPATSPAEAEADAAQPASPAARTTAKRQKLSGRQRSSPALGAFVKRRSGRSGAPPSPLGGAMSCQLPGAEEDVAAATMTPPSLPVAGPNARRPRGPPRSQSARNAWAAAELPGMTPGRPRRLRSSVSIDGGGGTGAFAGAKAPMLALSFERRPRGSRGRLGALLASCARLRGSDSAPLVAAAASTAAATLPAAAAACLGGAPALPSALAAAVSAMQRRHDSEGLRLQRCMGGGTEQRLPPLPAACSCKWSRGRGCGGGGCAGGAAAASMGCGEPTASVTAACSLLMAPLQKHNAAATARPGSAALQAEQRQHGVAGAWDDLLARHALEAASMSALAAWLALEKA